MPFLNFVNQALVNFSNSCHVYLSYLTKLSEFIHYQQFFLLFSVVQTSVVQLKFAISTSKQGFKKCHLVVQNKQIFMQDK